LFNAKAQGAKPQRRGKEKAKGFHPKLAGIEGQRFKKPWCLCTFAALR
jgi:hypothetical protein